MTGKRGRPRNVETQNAILTAAYELLLEHGFAAVTIEKIAERAQVSKATIYKWWPNKGAVIMDGYMHEATARLPVPDTGSVFEDIQLHASNLARFLTSREGKVITEIIGEGQSDPGLAVEYQTRYIQPRRREAWGIIEKGVERGDLKPDCDIALCIDLVYGSIFYRMLVSGEPMEDGYVNRVVTSLFDGIRK
ncbi:MULTISPECIES: TetR/AcrR family transcriptional regulator [unclassified Paenibacillus]|uniref:TetR/AcrR family transcriptional regulator n=1 Tax=unclassified Paenibacillus TaxID=185978 RepID=UPI000FE23D00|nr:MULTISPECIES: TetR/AcrR family transcriptional regulator [unclassified Paenibacillus]MCM3174793.1 TetR/AcrR family transcriptional regulator [Paenibacillus sp. MER 99-2]